MMTLSNVRLQSVCRVALAERERTWVKAGFECQAVKIMPGCCEKLLPELCDD